MGQGVKKFRLKANCRIYGERHHVSICNSSNHSEKLNVVPVVSNSTPTIDSNAALDPGATAWVESTTSGNKVALQTALEFTDGKGDGKVRVLFDSGSQKSFIASVCMLGLNIVRKENLGTIVWMK